MESLCTRIRHDLIQVFFKSIGMSRRGQDYPAAFNQHAHVHVLAEMIGEMLVHDLDKYTAIKLHGYPNALMLPCCSILRLKP